MLLHHTYQEPAGPPELDDHLTAARAGSFICALAGLWFFLSPFAYFGVSEQPIAWNAWLVGAAMLSLAAVRLFWTASSTGASYFNAVLGFWVLISPWVLGYSNQIAHTVNNVSLGAVVVAFSLFSASFTRNLHRLGGLSIPERTVVTHRESVTAEESRDSSGGF